MAGSIPTGSAYGIFIPTTRVYNSSQVKTIGVEPLLVYLAQDINAMSNVINLKTSGYYAQEEYLDGNQWFPDTATIQSQNRVYRSEFRAVVDFGALPNATSKSVAHGLDTTNWTITNIYGAATDPSAPSFIPIPFASPTLNLNISLSADNTNVVITTGVDRTAYTGCYVVLEYLKS